MRDDANKYKEQRNRNTACSSASKSKNRNLNKPKIIIICVLAVLIVLTVISFFLKEKFFWFWLTFSVICATLDFILLSPVLKRIFQPLIEYFTEMFNPESTAQRPKLKIKKPGLLLSVMAIEMVLLFALNAANAAFMTMDIPEKIYTNEEIDLTLEYDFSTVVNENCDFDIYFKEECDIDQFLFKLKNCFSQIKKVEHIPSEAQLEGANNYGNNAKNADEHERAFHELWNSNYPYVKEGNIPVYYCDEIINLRTIMDNTFKTPENRRQLMDVYLRKGILQQDKECFEWAVRYAFAAFYTELTWGNYSEYYIDKIIEMYEHLEAADGQHENNIDLIIGTFKYLKSWFEINPPGNVIIIPSSQDK